MIYAGVDIGGTNIKLGLIDDERECIVADTSIKTRAERPHGEILEDIASNLVKLCESAKIDFHTVEGVGMGIPGIVDQRTGTVSYCANLGWRDIPITHLFEVLTGKHTEAANDANCAAWGEYKYGCCKGMRNVILITLGTGVGSGIILDGRLFGGIATAGGEAGHMIIVKDGLQCNCGLRGCWERYASATALIEQTKAAIEGAPDSVLASVAKKSGKVTARTAFAALEKGDPVARKVVDGYIDYIVTGLINLGNIFHPNAFVIGGGVSNEGAPLIAPLEDKLNAGLIASAHNPRVRVLQAALGNKAGVMGAAALAKENLKS